MDILYLCADRGIPIRGHKGAAIHVRALADAFTRAGHHVTILSPRAGDGPAPLAGIVEVPLPPLDDGANDDAPARERQAIAYNDLLFAAAQEQFAERDFDFIYERYSLWSDAGARLTAATGRPLVLEVNAPLRLEAARYRSLSDPETAAWIETAQFNAACAIGVVSEELKDYVVSRGGSPERVHVLPNGVDPQFFHPAVRGGAHWQLDNRIVIGFVGRPRPWHDLETLLAAVSKLRAEDARYHLLLVGEMPKDLPARLATHGLSDAAIMTGPVAHNAVPEYIAVMDVAVSPHPALDNFYFSPLKLFEYMACGVPTIAAAVGQPAKLIRDGETGYLYPPGDADALASRIRALIARPERAQKIAWQGAGDVLEHHTWDGNARVVVSWIESAPPSPNSLARPRSPKLPLPILDSKLRQRLYHATCAELVAPFLACRLPNIKKHSMTVSNIKILKYKPGRRCVLAYTLAIGDQPPAISQRRVIGKVFRDERGERLFRLQEQLWQDGFGPHAPDRIHVPEALAYIPEMQMLVQECAAGATLNELAMEAEARPLVRRSAEGLVKLHNADSFAAGEPLGQYYLMDELANLDRFTADLTAIRPDAGSAVSALRDSLRAWGAQLPALPGPTPVHRDFYYSQVLFDGPRLTLIDFDLLALGDPAIDAANFSAHLFFLGLYRLGNMQTFAPEADQFLEAYSGQRPVDASFLKRMAFYQAATFFRLINVVSSRPNLAHHFDALYRQTARCLEAA